MKRLTTSSQLLNLLALVAQLTDDGEDVGEEVDHVQVDVEGSEDVLLGGD